MALSDGEIKRIVQEISQGEEKDRRARAQRRIDIYRDGGKRFLIEALQREFGHKSISEMRPCPINLVKKIVNKRSAIYSKPPVRIAPSEPDQALVDYYEKELKVNEVFKKANRYFNLCANDVIYTVPNGEGGLTSVCVPPTLYSKKTDPVIKTKTQYFVFNSFIENSMIASQDGIDPATGHSSFSENKGLAYQGDLVDSGERQASDSGRFFVFWGEEEHFTTNKDGVKLFIPGMEEGQYFNPIGRSPVVEVTKDRDNEAWAEQGDDLIDLTIAIQLGWTDLLTIAKHQGFSLLTIKSHEEPKQLRIGINKAVWLKQQDGMPEPSIGYVQAASPLSEYKEILAELLGLTLTTNDMNPGSITGRTDISGSPSGFSKLIEMADILQAISDDAPIFKSAEYDYWDIVAKWHNFLYDSNLLSDDARALGRFSEDFKVEVQYKDIKPLESEQERIDNVIKLIDKGLLTRKLALKKLNPDSTDEQIEKLMEEIEEEQNGEMEVLTNLPKDESSKVMSLVDRGLMSKKQALQKIHPDASPEDIDSMLEQMGSEEKSMVEAMDAMRNV